MSRPVGTSDTVAVRHSKRVRAATGVRTRPGAPPKISILFDQSQFERINSLAVASRITFAEQARCLIAYAFDQLDKED